MDAKSQTCELDGYDEVHKGYQAFDPLTLKFLVSRDAIFDKPIDSDLQRAIQPNNRQILKHVSLWDDETNRISNNDLPYTITRQQIPTRSLHGACYQRLLITLKRDIPNKTEDTCIHTIIDSEEPICCFKEAIKFSIWQKGMQDKIDSLQQT